MADIASLGLLPAVAVVDPEPPEPGGSAIRPLTPGRAAPPAAAARPPRYAVGERVRSLAEHMPGMAGRSGVVVEARAGAPPYYAVRFDGVADAHKWLTEDELSPEAAPAGGPPPAGMAGMAGMEAERPEAPAESAAPAPPAFQSLGFVLEAPEADVVKWVTTRRAAQDGSMRNRDARWRYAARKRAGDPWVQLRKLDEDQDIWFVYTPPFVDEAPPGAPDKTDDLCVKVVSTMLADPPRVEAEPSRADEEAKAAAEFSGRLLADLNAESGLNTLALLRDAEEQACASDSSFIHNWVDPNGGGYQPKQILASPWATTEADALFDANGMAQPGPYVVRYVRVDGVLTDDPSEAAMQWLPALRAKVLHPRHVRFLPPTASGIADAWGVIVSDYVELSRLKALAQEYSPEGWTLTPEQVKAMVDARPTSSRALLPSWACDTDEARKPGADGLPPGDALVYCDILYITGKGNPDYPKGACVWVAAEKHVIARGPWTERIAHDPQGPTVDDTAEPGSADKQQRYVERPCDIPVTQVKQFVDPDKRDPYGRGLVAKLGNDGAAAHTAFGLIVESMFNLNNPHLFVPIGSGINAQALAVRGVPIDYNPTGGGRPWWLEQPQPSPMLLEIVDRAAASQDAKSGLQQIAQGLADPSITSGVQAQSVVEQALKALAEPKQFLDDAFVRQQRIQLQLVRRKFTMPQRLRIVGADGAYKAKEWTAADLGSTSDVRIAPGTSTMLTPSAKDALLLAELQAQAITMEDYQRAKAGRWKLTVGLQDNPHRLRVAGQIDQWESGPPEGWAPLPPPPVDPVTGGPPVDPMTGQPVPPPVDPADPFAVGINDDDPAVAPIRYQELVRAVSSVKYRSKPPEWRALLDAAYLRARQAAGVSSVAEQQAAAAAAVPAGPAGAPPAEAAPPTEGAGVPPGGEGSMMGAPAGLG